MKVGRNDPCPCGSGKKYKQCHGASIASSKQQGVDRQTITITASGSLTEHGKQLLQGVARDQAFEQLVRRIDDDLREEGVPIPDRPEAALRVAEKTTGQSLPSNTPDRDPTPGSYGGEDLAIRIRRWYQQHYGGALGPAVRIGSEAEFLEHLERIDQELKERDIPIPGRPMAAIHEFAMLLKEELRGYALDRDPVPGRYTGDDLIIHVERWYKQRYGDRILMEGKDGQVVVLLRGDPWVMELPWILGGGRGPNFICGYGRPTTLPSEPVVYRRGDPPPPPSDYNVLDSLAGLPDGLARALTEEECEDTLEAFLVGRAAYTRLSRSRREGLLALVRGNLEAAVAHLSGNVRQAGLSQWESLQAAEKVLKAYIEAVVGSYKHGHKLSDFETQAVKAGLPPMDPAWLPAIQCSAGVRYGEVVVSLKQAVAAHHASLRVVAHVLTAMP